MRSFIYFILFFFYSANSSAQQTHFVYIQTENKQLFYVKLNEKIFSSTSSGYVILPKLTDGSYKLNIGFPKNEWPVQNIDVVVKERDAGFLLKNFDTKGWGLFNLQTLEMLMASAKNEADSNSKSNMFSSTLAVVTNTSPVGEKENGQAILMTLPADSSKKEIKTVITPALEIKTVNQLNTELTNSGRSIVYRIVNDNSIDTVSLLIAYTSSLPDNPALTIPVKQLEEQVKPKAEKPLITDVRITDKTIPSDMEKKPVIVVNNPLCRSLASKDDLVKLQKKLALEKDEENKIAIARKSFNVKCFSVNQVKLLGESLKNDKARYQLFDAAYEHMSDPEAFAELQSQLADEYYITRFKAMLR
jgi:hypothetical protein